MSSLLAASLSMERRDCPRYPLSVPVQLLPGSKKKRPNALQAAPVSLTGWAVNMSSSGLLFTTSAPVKINTTVNLEIAWPARLHNRLPMVLRIRGKVVRAANGEVAIRITQREFRVKRTSAIGKIE